MAQNHHTVYFDGVCNLCNGFIQFLIKRDPQARFRFAALQSEAGQSLLTSHSKNAEEFDSILYQKGNKLLSKSQAVLAIVNDLGGIWKLSSIARIVPTVIADWVYDQVATNRYRLFGKKDSCMIPSPELSKRFLS